MEGIDRPTGALLQSRYRVGEIIGTGGMAWVYRAVDESLDREVAVKIFHVSPTSGPNAARQAEEVKVLARLNHHGLVTILDAGVARDQDGSQHIFFVMELVPGTDLGARLTEGRLTSQKAAYIGFDMAEALDYIHQQGVIHRDVKPANILLVEYSDTDSRPRAKLADFGVAKIAGSSMRTVEGAMLGTAAYLSPEQATGGPITPAVDVYALGLVLLECLTGVVEFPGDIAQSAVARLTRDPVIPPELPTAWRVLLSAMTARRPEDRPPLREAMLDLRQIIVGDFSRHRAGMEASTSALTPARYDPFRALRDAPDEPFERMVRIASTVFHTPVAIVTVLEGDRSWFRSQTGLPDDQVERHTSVCSTVRSVGGTYTVPDFDAGDGLAHDSAVVRDNDLRSYAGAPLRAHDGSIVGALCVLDTAPRVFGADELALLEDLAGMLTTDLELRRIAALAMAAQDPVAVPLPSAEPGAAPAV